MANLFAEDKQLKQKRDAISQALQVSLFEPSHRTRHEQLIKDTCDYIDSTYQGDQFQAKRMHEKRRVHKLAVEIKATEHRRRALACLAQAGSTSFTMDCESIKQAEKHIVQAGPALRELATSNDLYSSKQCQIYKQTYEALQTSLLNFHFNDLMRSMNVWIRPERLVRALLGLHRSFILFLDPKNPEPIVNVQKHLVEKLSEYSLLSLLLLNYKLKSYKLMSLYDSCEWQQNQSQEPFTLLPLMKALRVAVHKAISRKGFLVSRFVNTCYESEEDVSSKNKVILVHCIENEGEHLYPSSLAKAPGDEVIEQVTRTGHVASFKAMYSQAKDYLDKIVQDEGSEKEALVETQLSKAANKFQNLSDYYQQSGDLDKAIDLQECRQLSTLLLPEARFEKWMQESWRCVQRLRADAKLSQEEIDKHIKQLEQLYTQYDKEGHTKAEKIQLRLMQLKYSNEDKALQTFMQDNSDLPFDKLYEAIYEKINELYKGKQHAIKRGVEHQKLALLVPLQKAEEEYQEGTTELAQSKRQTVFAAKEHLIKAEKSLATAGLMYQDMVDKYQHFEEFDIADIFKQKMETCHNEMKLFHYNELLRSLSPQFMPDLYIRSLLGMHRCVNEIVEFDGVLALGRYQEYLIEQLKQKSNDALLAMYNTFKEGEALEFFETVFWYKENDVQIDDFSDEQILGTTYGLWRLQERTREMVREVLWDRQIETDEFPYKPVNENYINGYYQQIIESNAKAILRKEPSAGAIPPTPRRMTSANVASPLSRADSDDETDEHRRKRGPLRVSNLSGYLEYQEKNLDGLGKRGKELRTREMRSASLPPVPTLRLTPTKEPN